MIEAAKRREIPHQSQISYGFRFEEHVVEPKHYERKKAHLLASMKQVLKPGLNNIVLFENEFGTDTIQRSFDAGFAHHNSFQLASTYSSFVRIAHRQPNRDELVDTRLFLRNLSKSNHKLLYELLLYDALDILQTEGYGIKVVFENGAKAAIPKPKEPAVLETRRQNRRDTVRLMEHARSRNQQLVHQLMGIENSAKKIKASTNVFVVFGTLHTDIPEMLPKNIQGKIVSASSEPNYLTVLLSSENATPLQWAIQSIMHKLMHGDKVSQEEWEEYFVLEGF